jgi:hypothetical protein
MTRPLALIEGDLTIPLPRPFDGLPPPFGSRHRVLREAVQHAVNEIAKPAQATPFPAGVKHILFYKAPPQRVDTHRVDAALEEAKRYLQMDTTRPRSSRSDYLLAGAIFAGCTIALTWLLVTCSMKEAEKPKTASITPAVAAWQAEIASEKAKPVTVEVAAAPVSADASIKQGAQALPAPVDAPKQAALSVPVSRAVSKPTTQAVATSPAAPTQIAQSAVGSSATPKPATRALPMPPAASNETAGAVSPSYAVQKHGAQASPQATASLSKQSVQTTARSDDAVTPPEKAVKRVKVARLSEAHVNERVALNRVTNPAAKAAASKQPEWTANSASNAASSEDAPWLNWAARPYRASPVARAATPLDNAWNDHMTQRRITDDPAAFHTERSGQ